MPRSDHETRVTPSVLDRLLDYDPKMSSEAPKSRSQTLKELKESVGRDLEWLLNTRQILLPDAMAEETSRSVVAFGIPDLTKLSPDKASVWRLLAKQIEVAIAVFEPRFLDVTVTLEKNEGASRSPRFRIDAHLNIDPAPEPISFGTSLESSTGLFDVQTD